MALSAQVVYDEIAGVLQNVVVFVSHGDVRSSGGFGAVRQLLHTLVVQRLYLDVMVAVSLTRDILSNK